jgi:hypothetical protein
MKGVPGGTTGLLVRTYKTLGSGESQRVVEEFTVDVALLKELREHEKQAAQELGHWIAKSDVTTQGWCLVDPVRQQAMLADERARELACELDARLAAPPADLGGVH